MSEPQLTAAQVKELVAGKLRQMGVTQFKLKARTVSFADLARRRMPFVEVSEALFTTRGVKEALSGAGYRVEFGKNEWLQPCDFCSVPKPLSDLHDITTCGDWWTVCTACKERTKTK